jgi:lipid-binding SYLF domain-containing protein
MKHMITRLSAAVLLAAGVLTLGNCSNGIVANTTAAGTNPRQLASDSRTALNQLCRQHPGARSLRNKAQGILVFPKVTKGGLMVGAMGGNGALIRPDGTIRDFYQTGGASYGLQAGVQQYGYALFLMDKSAFDNINRSSGWEVGSSPSLVVVDQGMAGALTTTTINKGTYAFFFNQRGLMGGLGLQGSKITRIHPTP